MRKLLAIGWVALLGLNAWLLLGQLRLERELQIARAENRKLAEEAAQPSAISPEEFRAAQARLSQASDFLTAVESRLTNANALLATLQQAAAVQNRLALTPRAIPRPRIEHLGLRPDGPIEETGLEAATEGPSSPAGPVSSSHSPDGQLQHRSWGPEQVLGPPDTHEAGDRATAWAPAVQNGTGVEWLHVNYDRPVDISEIIVRETHNAGAIAKVAAVLPNGQETVVWEGTEPPSDRASPVDMSFTVPPGVQAQSVKVYLDRRRVPGWNEIDAVELVGRDGTRQWASSATASSSFAEPARR
jgi:hypothetical protein